MFKKSDIKILYEKTTSLQIQINELRNSIGNPVFCEVCGCFIPYHKAIRGKSEIHEIKDFNVTIHADPYLGGPISYGTKEIIYTPYYCRSHIPPGDTK